MLFTNEQQLISNGRTTTNQKARKHALELLKIGIDAVDPYTVMSSQFKGNSLVCGTEKVFLSDFSRIFLVSFGKASIGMSQAVLDHCPVLKGVVITNDASKNITNPSITTIVGGHPIPNQGSINGTKAIEKLIDEVKSDDLLIVLISGGGSALLCHPRVSLKDMQETTLKLLKSGASIQEINTVRKHLSFVKGGQLVQHVKGKNFSYIISDIIGDPIGFIASGPTVGDETSFGDVKKIFKKYYLWDAIPPPVQTIIQQGLQKRIPETPTNTDLENHDIHNEIIANNQIACNKIYQKAIDLGYTPLVYSNSLDGEAKCIGNKLIDIFIEKNKKENIDLMISGGETTVTVKGKGKGGRNQEMVLATLEHINRHSLLFTSCGTDGIDGMSKAAGAIADPDSWIKSQLRNLDINEFIENNDSYRFFSFLDDLLLTGPTGTNVMDIQIIIKIDTSNHSS